MESSKLKNSLRKDQSIENELKSNNENVNYSLDKGAILGSGLSS